MGKFNCLPLLGLAIIQIPFLGLQLFFSLLKRWSLNYLLLLSTWHANLTTYIEERCETHSLVSPSPFISPPPPPRPWSPIDTGTAPPSTTDGTASQTSRGGSGGRRGRGKGGASSPRADALERPRVRGEDARRRLQHRARGFGVTTAVVGRRSASSRTNGVEIASMGTAHRCGAVLVRVDLG